MALTAANYTQGAGQRFQDVVISPATLADGTLYQRFEIPAFPAVGKKVSGTHPVSGRVVPKAARPTTGEGA
jgi:hypothetical protein